MWPSIPTQHPTPPTNLSNPYYQPYLTVPISVQQTTTTPRLLNTHLMLTRAKYGISKHADRPFHYTNTTLPIPRSHRSPYGLKQAPCAWFQRFASYATRAVFKQNETGSLLFIFHRGTYIAYLLLYVDDIILTASSVTFLQKVVSLLHGEYSITDMGYVNYSLGVSAQCPSACLFLSLATYVEELFERAHMKNL
ncbi:ribonuclease H-like domain-containing protein [Tanacetum coccineum]